MSATDVIEIGQQFYIRARSSLADARTLSLLHNDTLAIFDRHGDIQPIGLAQQGIFFQDTRHLSRLELRIGRMRPLLLSSSIQEANVLVTVDMTNPDMDLASGLPLARGILHLHRHKVLADAACFERITAGNYGQAAVDFELNLFYAADFLDMFEVRGQKRLERGVSLPEETGTASTTLSYRGLDDILRRTRIACSVASCTFREGHLAVPIHLEPQAEQTFFVDTCCEAGGEIRICPGYDAALRQITEERRASPLADFRIYSANEQFNDWVNRSLADLQMLLVSTRLGFYPYAGVPWFSTVFGRDGIVTALQLLCPAPQIARGVLAFLADTQATSRDPERDAEPGRVDVGLDLTECDRSSGQRPVAVKYRVLRVLPALLQESSARPARILDEAIAVRVTRLIDPLQCRLQIGPDVPQELEIRGALVIGSREHQEQRGGVDTAVVAVEWDFAQPRHLALAHFVQYLARLGVAFRIAAGRLRVREESQDSTGNLRSRAQ